MTHQSRYCDGSADDGIDVHSMLYALLVHIDILYFQLMYEVDIGINVEATSCMVLTLKAVNPVGLWKTSSTDLIGCDKDSAVELIVLDAIGDWDFEANNVLYAY